MIGAYECATAGTLSVAGCLSDFTGESGVQTYIIGHGDDETDVDAARCFPRSCRSTVPDRVIELEAVMVAD
ncbi:hypothetical protein [Natrinema sp. SYSU A 869]|uniref:hypothetical protein n=1 Tax=Natrinema sp. SYSU A 869 TaxID=2871694 RepID=UPI001CA3C7C9|nr:hypothetical protein [Natrinema sp. SYSU A 869]